MILFAAFAIAGILLSLALTGVARAFALRAGLSDVPNHRSSHSKATPRGGGLAIVLAFTVLTAVFVATAGQDSWSWVLKILMAGLLVAGVGWIDDVKSTRARTRILVHLLAALVVLWPWVGIELRWIPGVSISGVPGLILASLYLVWSINFYNFMDGIDGIAAGECVIVMAGMAWISMRNGSPTISGVCVLLGAACLGFLKWNWSPAKIFMGDVGSGFLGITIGALAFWAGQSGAIPMISSVILLGCFVTDATFTLLRRLIQGQRVYEAHRDHAYQHAVQKGFKHSTISSLVILITLFWLLPWAAFVAGSKAWQVPGLVISYSPLIGLAIWLKAGDKKFSSKQIN